MRLNTVIMLFLVLSMSIFILVEGVCPNGCSGHGSCVGSVCNCFKNVGIDGSESYGGADCSEHTCFVGNPFGAVHSKSPSENGAVSYSSVSRELSEYYSNERQASDQTPIPSIKLVSKIDDSNGQLWKVGGLEAFMDVLPPSGGILSCRYYKMVDSTETLQKSPTTVDILSFGEDYANVLFDKDFKGIGAIPDGATDTYSKVECDSIISTRDDLSQLNPTTVEVTTDADPITSLTWLSYGPVLLDMGLLTPDTTGKIFKNDNFRFACYSTTTISTETTEVIVYDKVEAVYDTTADPANKNVVFTFKGEEKPTATSMCLCLMNSYGSIDIEYSEAFNNMRKDESTKKYLIGKYTPENIIKLENNYPVAITSSDLSGNTFTVTYTDAEEKYKSYFDVDREVYTTILSNGIFSEKNIKIATANTIALPTPASTDLVMPYLRISPISELTSLPKANIIKQTPTPSSPPYLYKAYYFAEDLLHSFNKEGGKLKCKYTPKDGENKETDTEIDVKGIARNNQTIFFSYFESEKTDLNTAKLDCYEVSYIRKDLTLLNPSTFTTPAPVTGRRQLDGEYTITWDKYGKMFTDMGFKSDKVSFACFNMNNADKKMDVHTASYSASGDSITFTINPTPTDDGTYLCYLLNTFTNPKPLELKDLPNSEIGDKIQVSSDGKSYFYGEFVLGEKTTLGKRPSDNSEVIILNSGSKIDLVSSDNSVNTIEITEYKPEEGFDIVSKLKNGKKFYLKMIKTASPLEEEYIQLTVNTISEDKDKKEVTITVTDISIASGYSPYYVIYLSTTTPTDPTTPPTPPPPTTTTIGENLYKISNYVSDDVLSKLSIIGGKLQCKIEDNKVELVDVKGIIYKDNKIQSAFYEFENANSKDKITSCSYSSSRNDMTLYNPIKYEGKLNYITMSGYGTILSEIGYSYGKKKMTCYNSKEIDINNRILSFYEVTLSNVKNGNVNDLKITFNGEKPKDGESICYLLSDVNGREIEIENSDLWELVRKEKDGKYYYGKSVIGENGKSEERKTEDGSVIVSFVSSAIFTNSGSDSDDKGDKMNLFNLNKPSPSFEIPPSYIEAESKKMLYPGTTITFRFRVGENDLGSQSSQIVKVENNDKKRFKILLSNQINVPTKPKPRLRLLQDNVIIPQELTFDIEYKTEGSTHVSIECSGQGSCDRSSGICKCYDGFSGSACQRLDCPNNCNGNGRCVALSELLSNEELKDYKGYGNKHIGEYKAGTDVSFDDQIYGCLCDKRHRGYDCSLIECPSSADPEGATNTVGNEYRDCSGRGICNYNTGVCECFDGFSGEGCQTQVAMM